MVNWSAVLLGAAGCQQAGGLVFAPRATVVSQCQQACRTPSIAIANAHGSSGAVLPRSRCRRGVCRMTADADDSAPAVAESLQHLTQQGGEDEDESPTAGYFSSSSSSSEDLPTAIPSAAAVAAATTNSSRSSRRSNSSRPANNDVISTVVSQEDDNAPIDWILSRRLPMNSRRFYRKALERGKVKVDRRTVKRFVRVRSGAKIFVDMGPTASSSSSSSGGADAPTKRNFLFPEHLPRLRVLFEDEHFFAVMKPAGMVCQPCEAAASGTVLHGLLHHMIQTRQAEEGDLAAAGTLSQGIVQRLDKNTSGIMIVAKSLDSSSKFSSLFKKAQVKKEYLAICHGDPGFDTVVDAPLYRRSSGKVGAVDKMDAGKFGARAAKTRVRNVATAAGLSLCRAEIITGRMHQVRVHLKWMGHPIVGDKEYGDLDADFRLSRRNANRVDTHRPLLHSMTLEFNHPFTNKRMSFRAPIPTDMWETTDNILRASGTPEQQEEFAELQETHQSSAADTAPVGGRGSPRFAVRKGRKGGRGGSGAREAYEAVLAAEADRDLAEAEV